MTTKRFLIVLPRRIGDAGVTRASQLRLRSERERSILEAAENCDATSDGRHTGELGPCEPLPEEHDSGEHGEGGELRREDGADRDAVAGADREGGKPSNLAHAREHHPRRDTSG